VTEQLSLAPVVEIGGRSMEEAQYDALRSLRVERGLGVVGRATLRFDDPGFELSSNTPFGLGEQIRVKQFPSTELFSGTVVGVSLEQAPAEQPQLVVIADDAAYKLTRGTKTTTHLQTTYTDAVQTILRKAGLKPQVSPVAGPNEYLLQAGSDLAFIDSIATRIGYVWWVDERIFHFAQAGTSTGQTTVTLNDDLDEFSVRASALRPTEVTVSGWSVENLATVSGNASRSTVSSSPPDFVRPYINDAQSIGAARNGSGELSPSYQTEAQHAAQALFDESLTASVVARGRGDVNGQIKPATTVQVDHAGPASGTYYVTEVQHLYDATGFRTRFVAGSLRPSGLVDTLGRPEPDPGFALHGLVIGVVTNNQDPAGDGRVKVRYAGIPDNIDSNWARVLTTSGGKDRGMVFLPEVEDEVLVGFEGSDARRPVVLGALFSQQNKLPEAAKILGEGKVAYRRITSRLGHVIEFADGSVPTSQHVLIKLGTAEHSLRLGADACALEIAAGKPLTVKAGTAQFAISEQGDVTIEGKNITIKAAAELRMESVQSSLKGTAQVQVQGAQVEVKGQTLASVEASGPLTLKGATVAVN
jgi:uncharacterized protein involved in type VI secretion and phage assembly